MPGMNPRGFATAAVLDGSRAGSTEAGRSLKRETAASDRVLT